MVLQNRCSIPSYVNGCLQNCHVSCMLNSPYLEALLTMSLPFIDRGKKKKRRISYFYFCGKSQFCGTNFSVLKSIGDHATYGAVNDIVLLLVWINRSLKLEFNCQISEVNVCINLLSFFSSK